MDPVELPILNLKIHGNCRQKPSYLDVTVYYIFPPLLRNWYINIGSKDYHEYSVPLTAEAIFDNCINHENSLIKRIEKVITLVGPESHLPILVEFFGSPNYSHIGMVYHLMGFAHAVRPVSYTHLTLPTICSV